MRISLIIADDHAFTLAGLQRSFEADAAFEVRATTGRGLEAISLAKRHRPDVALLDYVLPDASGVEVLAEIRHWAPETRVAILTGSTDLGSLRKISEASPDGIFSKGDPPPDIRAGLLRVAMGDCVIGTGIARTLDEDINGPALSKREQEVLEGIAEGLSNPRMAEKLNISPKTVDSHRTSLMRKLDANSTATLLIRAIQLNILRL